MPQAITISQAKSAMLRRSELSALGHTERQIRRAVETGEFVVVRRGWYIGGRIWRSLWPEGRHLLRVVAVHNDAVGALPIFCGPSAAVVHGFPLYRADLSRVHAATMRGASRSAADVLRHEMAVADVDVVEVEGLLCTSPVRTVFDASRMLSMEAAVAVADAALGRVAVNWNVHDVDAAAAWKHDLRERAAESSMRGIAQARRVVEFADGRSQSAGESVSRLHLHRLGFREIEIQVPIRLPGGDECWVDFGLDEVDAFGEFDGKGKYLDPALRNGRSVAEVLLDEKRREDFIRGVTGRRFLRWKDEHIRTSRVLGARLRAFGVHPPGR